MVNGNYVVQDVNKEIIENPKNEEARKTNIVRGVDRKNTNKRRGYRTATELNLTLPLKKTLETEDNSNTTIKTNGEPNLLRYATVTEESDDSFYCKLERRTGESPRRNSFAKKPKNPSDGSNNYARTNGVNNGSPNGNLPTISENTVADSFEMMSEYSSFRVRSYTDPDRFRRIPGSNVSELYPDYSSAPKFDTSKYFSKPIDGHKFAAKGTHPDSLYRVTLGSGERARGALERFWRLVRWPAALLAVCVVLALFIYYVMPDSAETELLDGNSTYWEAGLAGRFRHHPAQHAPIPAVAAGEDLIQQHSVYDRPPDGKPTSSTDDPEGDTGSKTTEIEFENTNSEVRNKGKGEEAPGMLPLPMYPEYIAPDVQYGDEKPHPGSDRAPKLIQADGSAVQEEESTLKTPYPQTKGDYALYIKSDEVSTEYNARARTTLGKTHTSDARSIQTGVQQKGKGNFTSGHSKLFGISIEDAERFEATTPNSLYNTRVSPTLPALPRSRNKYSMPTTTRRSETDDGLSCRSTSLDICRRVLPYDLAAAPILPTPLSQRDLTELVSDLERLAGFACNPRVIEFMCHLLEPECTASAMGGERPCRKFCEDSLNGCEGHIYANSTLENMLFCNQYAEVDCIQFRAPCYEGEIPCDNETCVSSKRMCDGVNDCPNDVDEIGCNNCEKNQYSCPQGACIPNLWLCDGYADCAEGEDEQNCRAGPDGFRPHPTRTGQTPPKWLQNWVKLVDAYGSPDNQEAVESMLSPVQLSKNSLPRPTKAERTRLIESSKMHDSNALKGDADIKELLMMSGSSSAARPHRGPPVVVAPHPQRTNVAAVGELLEDLEKMVDAEKWWEQTEEDFAGAAEPQGLREGAGTAHASPCPSGELRCVDGRCIMFSQLCDGRVDCTDHADEDNCNA